jgi:hypothetical protein
MRISTKKILTVALATLATVSISVSSPASAAAVNSWGEWQYASEMDTNSGVINFGTGQVGATWSSAGSSSLNNEIIATNVDGEFMDSHTPIAAAFSANSSSLNFNYLKAHVAAADLNIVTVTFATPVPAGDLGIAISDIDSDQVTVSGTTDGTTTIPTEQLGGTALANASTLAFNFCAHRATGPCSNNTEVVPVTYMQDEIKFGAMSDTSVWGTDGSSGWIHPSVAVKTLRFYIENGDQANDSSERIWFVQKSEGTTTGTGLANTGINSQGEFSTAAGIVFAGFGLLALSAIRRRGAGRHRA